MFSDLMKKILPNLLEEMIEESMEDKELRQRVHQLELELKHERQIKSARSVLQSYFLEFRNNYLTVEKFAEHHRLSDQEAKEFLVLADKVFHSNEPEY